MSCERHFLGWHKPALTLVSDYLFERYNSAGLLSLQDVAIVLPGSRAARRLIELLATRAEEKELFFIPPRTFTLSSLLDELCDTRQGIASPLERELAMQQVLLGTKADLMRALSPQGVTGHAAVNAFASRLLTLWDEISVCSVGFSNIGERGGREFESFNTERWQSLDVIFEAYHELLAGQGLCDKNRKRAAALAEKAVTNVTPLYLVALLDLRRLPRELLGCLKDKPIALIPAPEHHAEYFDDMGCVFPEKWLELELPITDDNIRMCWDYAEEASAVVTLIAEENARWAADEITIAVSNDAILPYLTRELHDAEIAARPVSTKTLSESGPAKLLREAATCIADDRYECYAAFLRHPDMERWLRAACGDRQYLNELDVFQSRHLQEKLHRDFLRKRGFPRLEAVVAKVLMLLSPFRDRSQKLSEWASVVAQFLVEVYRNAEGAPPERELGETLELFGEVLGTFRLLPAGLDVEFTGAEAIQIVLQECGRQSLGAAHHEDAIDIVGWLELPLDDAPFILLCGATESSLPESLNADIFLPNALRKCLGLVDNDIRYARDACALTSLYHSHESMKILASRHNERAESLLLSRLLLTSEKELPSRVMRFYAAGDNQIARREVEAAGESIDALPRPVPLVVPPSVISVTGFKEYLACPYRYYLKYMLGLRSVSDEQQELDAMQFGSLAHEVLARFAGEAALLDCSDHKRINDFLQAALVGIARETFGTGPLPSVRLQIEQLRYRLSAFSRWQAAHTAAGWRLTYSELAFKPGSSEGPGSSERNIKLDIGEDISVMLSGRIDRIDYNEAEGRWLIFDYKTSEKKQTVEGAHLKKGAWVDVQMPAYHYLFKQSGLERSASQIQLAYLSLDCSSSDVSPCIARWEASDLESALAEMRRIARCIYEQKFWPPKFENWRREDEFSLAWGIPVLDREALSEEAMNGEAGAE